ncbi:MAG: DUF5916 domain-containing protein [Vicinamibacterales bacterium]
MIRRAVVLVPVLAAWLPAAAAGQAPPVSVPSGAPEASAVFSGLDRRLQVDPPRVETEPVIDGQLDEPVWQAAAHLTGFSRYAPVDGGAAERQTDILVWYSPTAIYFGVRAKAGPDGVQATLADRDRIDADDHVQIFLSTFGDGRQAFVFAVNPLGVQMDGALVEGLRSSGGGFSGLAVGREEFDRSPDFVFQSRGLVDADGYVVEIRIPFKSLRYQAAERQRWGLHVTRVSPRAGVEDSWAPARREGASFLSQAGTLEGLHDLRRGLVLDLNPVVTSRVDGTPSETGGGWAYDGGRPDWGLNVRWGVTQTLTLNGTVNPDFSQVEADAGQFQFDPRQALFFPDKRPFFLDGIEQYATPNNLIYTRRVVAPLAAAKVTGRLTPSTSVAYLSAVDDPSVSASGRDHPVFNVLRAQRDVGTSSKIGLVYTDRVDGPRSNRVIGLDTRLVWKDIYSLLLQGAASRTDTVAAVRTAPLWQATFNRAGRRYGLRVQARGIDPDFQAQAGFITRGGIAQLSMTNQLVALGGAGQWFQRFSSDVVVDGTWVYDRFVAGESSQDRKLHFNQNLTLNGGWKVGGSVLFESFGYDERLYRDYFVAVPGPDGAVRYEPYVGTRRLPNLDYVLSAETPTRGGLNGTLLAVWGKDENFFEWSSADIVFLDALATWRPTNQLRVEGRYQLQSYQRRSDGSYAGIRRIPRLRVEYQVARPIFVRVIAEQDANYQDALRDDSRTNLPIVIRGPDGRLAPASRLSTRRLRLDTLFSYQPTPGTVVFAGYGSSLAADDDPIRPGRRSAYGRRTDGFFLKISYLLRL